MFVKLFNRGEKISILAKNKNSSSKLLKSPHFLINNQKLCFSAGIFLFCPRTCISVLMPSKDSSTFLILPRGWKFTFLPLKKKKKITTVIFGINFIKTKNNHFSKLYLIMQSLQYFSKLVFKLKTDSRSNTCPTQPWPGQQPGDV